MIKFFKRKDYIQHQSDYPPLATRPLVRLRSWAQSASGDRIWISNAWDSAVASRPTSTPEPTAPASQYGYVRYTSTLDNSYVTYSEPRYQPFNITTDSTINDIIADDPGSNFTYGTGIGGLND